MALTSSGQISINDINVEFGRSGTTANSSLEDLSDGTVATINTANDSGDRPDGSAPHNMTEFYSYDHDAASTSWSTSGNTNLHCSGAEGTTAMASGFATLVLTGGSGGIDIENYSTSGGPFGSLRFQYTTDGSTPSTSTSGVSSITSLQNSLSSFNSGTLKLRPGWLHEPSNKDGTGSYTFTVRNNSVDSSAITGNITFPGIGGLCIHHSILVDTPSGLVSIDNLSVDDLVFSYNLETGQVEETPIIKIEKPRHNRLVRIMYENEDNVLDNIIVTRDHPIYLSDNSMASYRPQRTKDLYNLNVSQLEENSVMKTLNGNKQIHRFEYMADEDLTYTILTKNNNFYAGGVLVHSEITE